MKKINIKSILFAFISIIIINSCKKVDTLQNQNLQTEKEILEKFTAIPHGQNPILQKIANKIKYDNDQAHFIADLAKRVGYPIWSASEIRSTKNNVAQRTESGEEYEMAFIPLSISNTQDVAGFLACKVYTDSVKINLFEDKDYALYGFNKPPTEIDAEDIASTSMYLDFKAFGHNTFEVTDFNLFNTLQPLSDTIIKYVYANVQESGITVTLYTLHCPRNGDCCGGEDLKCCGACWNVTILYNEPLGGGYFNSGGGYSISGGYNPNLYGWWIGSNTNGNVGWNVIPPKVINATNVWRQFEYWERIYLGANLIEQTELFNLMNEFDFNEESINASHIVLIALKNNILNGPYNQQSFDLIKNYFNSSINSLDPVLNALFWMNFSVECARLKLENPSWSNLRIYWEASNEMLHLTLDMAGMVPVYGEVFDITNAILYGLQGQGTNAVFSAVASIPFVGWAATPAKYAYKSVQVLKNTKVIKASLKFYKNTAGKIKFGKISSNKFRELIGLIPGDGKQAHHIIPWELADDVGQEVLQKAGSAGLPFHPDDVMNGIGLGPAQHMGNHPQYTEKVRLALLDIYNQNGGANMTPQVAYTKVVDLINTIKVAIIANPTVKVNDLIF